MYSLPKMLLAEAVALVRGGAVLQAALLLSAMTLSHAQIQTINEYTVPSGQFSQPVRIIVGPDGALWFTDSTNARIGRITTAGAITSFAVPATSLGWGITVGPDGALWFTAKDKIGRMTTDGTVTMYPVSPTSFTYGITTGPDGALWFTDDRGSGLQADAVGRITTNGIVTEYPLPGLRSPTFITSGPDGALWFTEAVFPSLIGRVTTAGTLTEYPGPGPTGGCSGGGGWIVPGPDGALWFTGDDRIGRITTAGVVTGFRDTNCKFPAGITVGPDGALWFTEESNIGRITTNGVIQEFPFPQLVNPLDITTGPDNALWVLEYGNGKIAQVILGFQPTQASCTFSTFGLGVNIPVLGPGFIAPAGINDFGTIVGAATPSNDQVPSVAFVRWANGGYSFPMGASSVIPTALVDRNDKGTSIGSRGGVPITLNGTTVKAIDFSGLGAQLQSVNGVTGINVWESIVGSYNTSNAVNGFKRWSNGSLANLKFPGASSTFPSRINDHGTVVGSYFVGPSGVQLPENGFIYQSGQWATLNYPNATFTHLVGVSNAGVVVGNAVDTDGGFFYENNTFKRIIDPKGSPTNVFGISPKLGLIVGTSNSGGFIATCK
jgi:virginiamycin B lyase